MRLRSLRLVLVAWWIFAAGGRHISTEPPTLSTSSTVVTDSRGEEDLISALGEFGLDLVSSDLNPTLRSKPPNHVTLRGRDIVNSRTLQHSVVKYLLQYGYLETVKRETEEELIQGETMIEETDLSDSLKRYQRLFDLEVTGTVTEETLNKMRESRCGMKDEEFKAPNRVKRYTVKRKLWRKKRLFYWFDQKYTEDMPVQVLRREFEKSLKLWSNAAGVTFIEVPPGKERRADIKISFEKGDHGDKHAFDGQGGTVAHAFFPRKGQLHFDDAEDFTADPGKGINFHFIATHELGHILGIDHTFKENAIMYPLYGMYPDKVELHEDDKAAAVAAVGRGRGRVVPLRKWS